MGSIPLLAVYLVPAGSVLLNLIRTRSISLIHISGLRHTTKRITLEDWLEVYGYLGLRPEAQNQPARTKRAAPWRLMGAGVALTASLILFRFILPLSLPLDGWNAFPVIQVAIAGGALASSLMLAFYRPRRWHLVGYHSAEYPYLKWTLLKEQGKTT